MMQQIPVTTQFNSFKNCGVSMYHLFSIKYLCILDTEYIYEFYMILKQTVMTVMRMQYVSFVIGAQFLNSALKKLVL
jgi:hypothetical protein